MASVPLRSTAVIAAPKDYSIPPAQQIGLLSVTASFVDNGAAGDWLPAVVIMDNNGNALVRAVDQGVKVTAGSDAEVSFFPGVKHAAAATTGTTLAFARAWNDAFSGDAGQTVNAGATANATFAHTSTTDASIITFTTTVHTNDTAIFGANGTYLMYVGTHWDVTDVALSSEIFRASGGENAFPHTPINPNTTPSFGDSVGSANSQDFAVSHLPGGATEEKVLLNNLLGTDQVVQQCYFVIVYLATG